MQEFATLLRSAGLTLEQVTLISGSFFSVVETMPAEGPLGKQYPGLR